MPTGFMLRHFIALCVLLACCAATIAARSEAVSLIGVIGSGAARTIKVGQTRSGITVLSVERERATIEFEGKTRVLALGQHYRSGSGTSVAGAGQSITLAADPRGHFVSEGSINGRPMLFLV